jgi:hypothetical protein
LFFAHFFLALEVLHPRDDAQLVNVGVAISIHITNIKIFFIIVVLNICQYWH